MYIELIEKFDLPFTTSGDNYKIVDTPENLYIILWKLTRDYDVELS